MCEYSERLIEFGKEEGRIEGRIEGKIEIICKMVKSGISVEEVAHIINESIETVQGWLYNE